VADAYFGRLRTVILLAGLVTGAAQAAVVEQPLYDFRGPDGALPESRLISDSAGNLYGTTSGGGAGTDGAVIRLSPPAVGAHGWTETVLYSFCALKQCADGSVPLAGVTADGSGGFFGVTTSAGKNNWGTLYHLTPGSGGKAPWTFAILHNFCDVSTEIQVCLDGGAPTGDLVRTPNGVLYGTTFSGGTDDWGAVFALAPPNSGSKVWTYTLIHSFAFSDGAYPDAGVTLGASNTLYGVTSMAGANGEGTAFELISPVSAGKPWTFAVIHQFCALDRCTDGASPYAPLIYEPGPTLYGTATSGGETNHGTVYTLSRGKTGWTYTSLHDFRFSDGADPLGGLVIGPAGALYGTTSAAGSHGYGTVFALKPPAAGTKLWSETILHDFAGGGDGANPRGALLRDSKGDLFGMALDGGGSPDDGQVYEIMP
jgi:uncharacterized repeat protein (TIGR03803 family)